MAKDQALYEFSKSIKEIANLLESDCNMNQNEQLFLENHLSLIGMAYAGWKLRNSSRVKSDISTNDQQRSSSKCEANSYE